MNRLTILLKNKEYIREILIRTKEAEYNKNLSTLESKYGKPDNAFFSEDNGHRAEWVLLRTDPDSRLMNTNHMNRKVCYNEQTAVYTKHHLIVAHEVPMVGAVPIPHLQKAKGDKVWAPPQVTLKSVTAKDFNRLYHFTDDAGIPYSNTPYIAFLPNRTEKQDITDKKGHTEIFYSQEPQEFKIHLLEKIVNNMEETNVENGKYNLKYRFTDNNILYADTSYIAYLLDSRSKFGKTDKEGYTDTFNKNTQQDIDIHLILG